MDFRETKRTILREMADGARAAADTYGPRPETDRFRRAYLELADEFDRRGARPATAADPDQLALPLETA